MNNKEICQLLKGPEKNKGLQILYTEVLPKVVRYVRDHGGEEDDGKDMFQEGVMVFYQRLMQNGFKDIPNVAGFIMQVSKNQWINRFNRGTRMSSLDQSYIEPEETENPDSLLMNKEKGEAFKLLFSKLEERCQEILKLSVFERKRMDEIAELMGFSSANAAKTQNYRCKKALHDIVHDHPHLIAALK